MGNKTYIKKSNLNNITNSISNQTLKFASENSKNFLLNIKGKNGRIGNGFLCKIPFPDEKNTLPVLITNNKVLKEKDIMQGSKIELFLKNGKLKFEITINIFRKTYTSKKYDITIIEIKENDGLDINLFLEIDYDIYKGNLNEIFKQNSANLVYYPYGQNIEYSPGVIKKIGNDNYYILNSNKKIAFGCPTLNISNLKVIGIERGNKKGLNLNIGTFVKIPIEEFNNEITIIYKEIYSEKIIFGWYFVEKNKDICKININGKDFKLNSEYIIKYNIKLENNLYKIKLKGINEISDISYMFSGCSSLLYLPDIFMLNSKNITKMNYMFNGCSSILSLPDISKWNTENVVDMNSMFYGCNSLETLPDISNWKTSKVTNMSNMFNGCKSLLFLPDISKWNTENVTNMSYMFYGCQSLSFLPDISKWNTKNVTDISNMFLRCHSLSYLPDISRWDTSNIQNMTYIFYGCISLSSLPDISKWNFQSIKTASNIRQIYYGCITMLNIFDYKNI